MMDRVSSTEVSDLAICELKGSFEKIPYIKELLPKDLSAYTQEVRDQVTFLLHSGQWHHAMESLQVAKAKLGYLIPKYFPDKGGEAEACLNVLRSITLPSPPEAPAFTYLKGDAPEKGERSTITTLNANVLFMPDDYTWFFGGVRRFEERVDEVAAILLQENADVISLQEVHSIDAAYALYERLKGQYAHFYFNIGPDDLTQDLDAIQMNSGLFVASRDPIAHPRFIPFTMEGRQVGINKGFFEGTLMVGGKPFGQLYHTHLNPFETPVAQRVRKEEAEMIVASMEHFPLFSVLLGDLNVNEGSKEWLDSPLSQKFIHNYPPGEGPTCTDTLGSIVETPREDRKGFEPEGHVCDYALLFPKASEVTITSRQVKFYDLEDPERAASDHQGVFSTITKGLTD
ncbi:MAG: endonuclease/exonuclease/phosphatase family protein [Chlamydiia bacterium]|nr:endonuclease/exonuclease/phosphatase family protein [Chlamydiia bacterium]